ncbi:MAG TPA: phage holin family protein [Dehalococcoidia bacterium]|jgi:putative membrane protein|nr:phage holin family protein [Dehalococcoidia bacterium]
MTDRDNLVALLVRWLMLAFSVWVAAEIVGGIHLEGLKSTLIVAAVLGLLNLYLRPIIFLFSLPFTIVTLGLFIVVINAILLGLTDWLVDIVNGINFSVDGVGAALLGAIIISIVNMLLGMVIHPKPV